MIVIQFLLGYLGAALIDIGLSLLVAYLFIRYFLGYKDPRELFKF